MDEPAHKYRVTLADGRVYDVKDVHKKHEVYEAALKSGMYGIATTNKGENIQVSPANLVSVEEINGDVAIGSTEVGTDEQEESVKKEILSNQ